MYLSIIVCCMFNIVLSESSDITRIKNLSIVVTLIEQRNYRFLLQVYFSLLRLFIFFFNIISFRITHINSCRIFLNFISNYVSNLFLLRY